MQMIITKTGIRIIPQEDIDYAFMRDTLELKNDGDSVKFVLHNWYIETEIVKDNHGSD